MGKRYSIVSSGPFRGAQLNLLKGIGVKIRAKLRIIGGPGIQTSKGIIGHVTLPGGGAYTSPLVDIVATANEDGTHIFK